jgi:HEAT repeat protein
VTACLAIAVAFTLLSSSSAVSQDPTPAGTAPDIQEHIANLATLEFPVRMHAARLIRRTPGEQAVPALIESMRHSSNEFVRFRAFVLLTAFSGRSTRDLVREAIDDRNDRIREVAYKWLERHPDERLADSLIERLKVESEFVRPAVVGALAALGADTVVRRVLLAEISAGSDISRSAAIEAVGRHRGLFALEQLVAAAASEGVAQDDAVLAIGRVGGPRALEALKALDNVSAEVDQARRAALCMLGNDCEQQLASLEEAALSQKSRTGLVRAALDALSGLAQERHEAALAAVLRLAAHGPVRERAAVALSAAALRQPEWVVSWLSVRGDAAERELAVSLIKDGFDRLEEEFAEEQFFASVRAGYWRASEGSGARQLAEALIRELEF